MSRRNEWVSCLACLALTAGSTLAQNIVYVDGSATGADTGASWTDAYTDLQSALGLPGALRLFGAANVQAWDINDVGVVVGEFEDDQEIVRGFIATPVNAFWSTPR